MWEVFGVTDHGEPELQGRSVLHREDLAEVAAALELSQSDVRQTVETALSKMADAREERPAPPADDKELTGWNGLALIALAGAARWLDEPRYRKAAERIGEFLLETAIQDGELTRGVRNGRPLGDAVLSDHALAGLGLLRLHAATGDERWLAAAMDRAEAIRTTFYDPRSKTFMQTPEDAAGLPVRMADLDDGVLPSGGSAATLLFLELGAMAGDRGLTAIAEEASRRTAGRAVRRPDSAGFLLVAIDHAAAPVREVVVAGAPDDPATEVLWAEVRPTSWRRILPVRVGADGPSAELATRFPPLEGKRARKGRPTAYVCERGSCQAPTTDPSMLRRQLRQEPR